MARNGSGTYNRAVSPYTAGTTITAATVNSEMDDIATALTGSMARDGQSPATANIPMGGFRITGLANAVASTDAAPLGQVAAKAGDTMTGALGVIAGTVSAPGLFVSGDTNTGLFQPSADTLAVAVGGVEVGRFGANGLQSAAPWVDLASATTTDLGAQTSTNLRITGTTTITGFGTAASGVMRQLRFAASLTLTHNATSLILPAGVNIITAAGDTATAISLGSGNWVVTAYQRANMAGMLDFVQRQTVSVAVGSVDFVLPAGFQAFEIAFDQVRLATDGASLWLRGSTDGGATFLAGTQYANAATYNNATSTAVGFTDAAANRALLTAAADNGASDVTVDGRYRFTVGSATRRAVFIGQSSVFDNTLSVPVAWNGTCWIAGGAAINAIRLLASSGNIASGTFTLTGIR